MNNWGIPDELEKLVRSRDSKCIYCGKIFAEAEKRGDFPSWEHIINDARIISEDNIALCCISCNSSKGAKALIDWLNSGYCKRNSIEYKRLAPVVKKSIWKTVCLKARSRWMSNSFCLTARSAGTHYWAG